MSYIQRTNPPVNYPPPAMSLEEMTKIVEEMSAQWEKDNGKFRITVGADWMMSLSDEYFLLLCGDKTIVVLTGPNGLAQIEERYNKLTSK